MGRNVDLEELFNLDEVECCICKERVKYLDEVDLDCDVKGDNGNPLNKFVVSTRCDNCDNDIEVLFEINVVSRRI